MKPESQKAESRVAHIARALIGEVKERESKPTRNLKECARQAKGTVRGTEGTPKETLGECKRKPKHDLKEATTQQKHMMLFIYLRGSLI